MSNKLNNIADIVVEILEDNSCNDVESLKNKVSLHLRNIAASLSDNFDQERWDKYISKKRRDAKNPVKMTPMQQAMLSLAKAKFKK